MALDNSYKIKFPSAIDLWLAVLALVFPMITVIVVLASIWPISSMVVWAALMMVFISLALPIWVFLATFYLVEQGWLIVRSGPFVWRIRLDEITSVKPTHSLLSGPALSLNRLEICYDNGNILMVSPRDQVGFIRAIGFWRWSLQLSDSSQE